MVQGFAFPAPVLDGRDAREVLALFDARQDEYTASRAWAGIKLERVYEMRSPLGVLAVWYMEADAGLASTFAALASSDLPVDREFAGRMRDVHDIDLNRPISPLPELVGEWQDPAVTKHRNGLGFALPLRPGQAGALREFLDQAMHHRRFEHHLSRRALGLTVERIFLTSSPLGDLACFYLEADDPMGAYLRFAASDAIHDVWFKEQCRALFPDGIDLDEPLPAIETIWDRSLALVPV